MVAPIKQKNNLYSPRSFLLRRNVALRPPPVADKGSKSARQNKELKEATLVATNNDYILTRTDLSCWIAGGQSDNNLVS